MNRIKILLLGPFLLAIVAAGFSFHSNSILGSDKQNITKFSILHTNDHHGHFWPNQYGEYGMPARATLVEEVRTRAKQDHRKVFLFSGGDINTGTAHSDLQSAKPDFLGMATMGYDAMAIGNHEFDVSNDVLNTQRDWANFPFLSANIYCDFSKDKKPHSGLQKEENENPFCEGKKDGDYAFQPYQVFLHEGYTIVVIGLTAQETPVISDPDHTHHFRFENPVVASKKVLKEIEKLSPDLVVGLAHIGHYPETEGGDIAVALAVPEYDVIVGGHSNHKLEKPVVVAGSTNGNNSKRKMIDFDDAIKADGVLSSSIAEPTFIVQAQNWGKVLGKFEFQLDENGKMSQISYDLIPVNQKKRDETGKRTEDYERGRIIPENLDLKKTLQHFWEEGEKLVGFTIGNTETKLLGRDDAKGETNLGRLITQAQAEMTGADISLLNQGGVRASIDPGEFSYGDLLMVMPFRATLCSFKQDTAQLKEYFEKVFSVTNEVHISGVQLKVKNGKVDHIELVRKKTEAGVLSTVARQDLVLEGRVVRSERLTLIMDCFLAAKGGANWPKMNHPEYNFKETNFDDAKTVKEYLETHFKKGDQYLPIGKELFSESSYQILE